MPAERLRGLSLTMSKDPFSRSMAIKRNKLTAEGSSNLLTSVSFIQEEVQRLFLLADELFGCLVDMFFLWLHGFPPIKTLVRY